MESKSDNTWKENLGIFLSENFVELDNNGHKFRISKFLVTQGQYESIMGNNPSYFKGEKLPVESVSWYDAAEFCNRLSAEFNSLKGEQRYIKTGESLTEDTTKKGFRLPTEEEWAYAASGEYKDNFKYSGSDDIDEVAWYNGNSDMSTHEVGTKKPNALGIYDMSGNVWEWCNDEEGSYRVLRGGSWGNSAEDCRVSSRGNFAPGGRSIDVGFRLVLPL